MSAFQTQSVLLDSQSGDLSFIVDSGEIWYNSLTGRVRVQTPDGIKSLLYSGDATAPTFQQVYNTTAPNAGFNLQASGSFSVSGAAGQLLFIVRENGTAEILPGTNGGQVHIGSPTQSGDLTIYGDLIVTGDQTIIGSQNVAIVDPILILNSGEIGPGITFGSGGITIDRGSGQINASLLFRESDDQWVINRGAGTEHIIADRDWVNANFVDNTEIVVISGNILNNVLRHKAGSVVGATFVSSGTPLVRKAQVVFTSAYADTNYSPSISSTANRSWSVESVSADGFVINANANTSLTGQTIYWSTMKHGESHSNG